MNLFFLDVDPEVAAEFNCDKHVVKMATEATQILYTVHALVNTNSDWRSTAPERKHAKTGTVYL